VRADLAKEATRVQSLMAQPQLNREGAAQCNHLDVLHEDEAREAAHTTH
jgi:hypothetical protein